MKATIEIGSQRIHAAIKGGALEKCDRGYP